VAVSAGGAADVLITDLTFQGMPGDTALAGLVAVRGRGQAERGADDDLRRAHLAGRRDEPAVAGTVARRAARKVARGAARHGAVSRATAVGHQPVLTRQRPRGELREPARVQRHGRVTAPRARRGAERARRGRVGEPQRGRSMRGSTTTRCGRDRCRQSARPTR
jgi:hypothetical protein